MSPVTIDGSILLSIVASNLNSRMQNDLNRMAGEKIEMEMREGRQQEKMAANNSQTSEMIYARNTEIEQARITMMSPP